MPRLDGIGKKSKIWETPAEELDSEPAEVFSDSELLQEFVQSELNTLGKKCGDAADRILVWAGIMALSEESAFNIECSTGELFDGPEGAEETGVSNLADLRETWQRAKYKSEEWRARFYEMCNDTKRRREALREEKASLKNNKSVEKEFLELQENLEIPGSQEVLCAAHYWDCECDECTN